MTEVSVGELFVRLIVSLGLVVGIMAVAASLMKRMQRKGLGGVRSKLRPVRIEVLGRQTLGRRSSVAIVKAGERGMVLGVTDQQVTLLLETDADELMTEPAPRTVPGLDDGDPSFESTWRNLTEQLRDRTVRRS